MIRLILAILILADISAAAQDFLDRDSLWQVYKQSKPDTNRVKLFIQLGQQYEVNDPDSALLLYENALALSKQLNYTRGIISYYTNATYVYNVMGRYDTSLVLNLKSVEIAKAFGDEERLAACLGNVASSYMQLKQHEKATDYFLQTIAILEKLNDERKLSILYSNLCILYLDTKQFRKAEEAGESSLQYARKVNNIYSITSSLVNLSTVYTSTGQFSKSENALREARELAKKSNNQYALMITALNLSDLNIKRGTFNDMKPYCDEALTLAKSLKDDESASIALRGLAIYHFNQDNPELAKRHAQQSLELAIQHQYTEHIGKAYSVLAEIAVLQKDFKLNNEYSAKSDSLRDVLLNESIASNIQELEARYQSEQKEEQIKDLQQEAKIKDLSLQKRRMLNYILGGALISILVIVFLARRTYQQKQRLLAKENQVQQVKIAQLESEKQLLASEAVIKGQEEERGRLAKDLHDGLGGLLSGVKFSLTNMKSNVVLDADSALVFERSLDMLDHSIAELRRVAHNMMPEVLVKFGLSEAVKSYCESVRQSGIFKLDFQTLGTARRMETNKEIILYRIIQELLNNIAKHANASHVLIQVAFQEQDIHITVEDNGVGFDTQTLHQVKGAGWANIRSRVEYLKGTVDIQSNTGQGTSVQLTIPA